MDSRAAAFLGLLAVLCTPAAAQAAPSVTVQKLDGSSRTFELANLGQDVEREYISRTAAGEQAVAVKGTSLNSLLSAAGADTIGVGSIEVSGGGGRVTLSPDQLSGGGGGSPVVFDDAGRAGFLRPAYNADDLNGDHRLAASSLQVRLRKRELLEVRARVSDAAVKVGQRITFTATGKGGAGQQLSYNWTFGDGSRRRAGAEVTHTFREQGSYNVAVGLTTTEDRAGVADTVRVRVGPAPKGPARAGGGTSADSSAPDSGTAAGADTGASGGTGQADSGPARAPASPSKSRSPAKRAPSSEPVVEGTLLAGATAAPQRPAARKRAARTGNDQPGDGGFRVPGVAWGVLVTLGLAGTGALMELRTVLPLPGRRTT